MPDPSTLGSEYDHLIDVIELVAQSAGGYVSYDATVRGRKTGDISRIDAAVYIPGPNDREDLYVVECYEGPRAAGISVVEQAASKAQNTGALRALAVSSSGFSRPARKRAAEFDVELVSLEDPLAIKWPSWIASRSFVTGDLDARVVGVTLPPAPGIPGNAFRPDLSREDAIFENPTGTKFTADRLFRRWLKIEGNEDALMEEADRADGSARRKTITLAFDRPMKLLGTTIKRMPAVTAANFEIEFKTNRRVIPVSLMVAPNEEDPWASEVALVSGAVRDNGEVRRVIMSLEVDPETGERRVTADVITPRQAVDEEEEPGEAPEEDSAAVEAEPAGDSGA